MTGCISPRVIDRSDRGGVSGDLQGKGVVSVSWKMIPVTIEHIIFPTKVSSSISILLDVAMEFSIRDELIK